MINRTILVGRMVRDPELKRTSNGSAVTNFTLALDNWKGNGETDTDFIPVTCFGKIAENTAQYCSKGSLVGIDGRIHSHSYTNKEGKNVTYVNVTADNLRFLDSKKSKSTSSQPQAGAWVNKLGEDKPYTINEEALVSESDINF